LAPPISGFATAIFGRNKLIINP